uniref:Adaptin ear-binding coat-associated protein 1 n=1 Tax=Hydra vulgaris TaxID=6087 RepID=T2M9U2_HYDVU
MSDDYERVLCAKNEVFVYKIPPRQSSRGYRASDWKLDQPDWTARLRIVLLNAKVYIKFEDRNSGELFAQAPIDQYPGPVVEAVSDSSRYFVIKIQDESGRHAFIGMGFTDRGDSFDFNVALQDHFKREKNENDILTSPSVPDTPLNLGFKEGQTIKINFGNKKADDSKSRSKIGNNSSSFPMAPGIPKIAPPSQTASFVSDKTSKPQQPIQSSKPQSQQPMNSNDWGDFASFTNTQKKDTNVPNNGSGWVQF